MSVKNKALYTSSTSNTPAENLAKPHSLRLRLIIWYGVLLTLMLIFFAVLVWKLTTDTLTQSVNSSVRAEARIAELAIRNELSPTPPYWPKQQLSLNIVDNYQEPGVIVKVLDTQGNVRYTSDARSVTNLTASSDTIRQTLTGQTVWYTTIVDNGRARVEALPIHAPSADKQNSTGPVIGTLLVAKSLDEINTTLLLLQTLLISVGLVTLAVALLGGWAIASRVLQPLAEMAKTARAIAVATAHGTRMGNLSRRVRRPGGRDEMTQVIDTFNEMLTNLEQATQAQRRFVADASHELRAPLTIIQGNLAFLKRHLDELPPEERNTMLADAHEETLRLAQLVEELLLLARADSHENKPVISEKGDTTPHNRRPQPVELDRVVLQLVRQFRGRLNVEGSKLKLEVGHIEPLRIQGDEDSLRQVLVILLDNALKYTLINEQQTENRVIVALERTEKDAILRVQDTGIGIDPRDLPHIFERFYRADQARSRKEGTGLGLSIAQTLVESLNGRITAESIPGQGTTFRVWLPLA
jgi:two-component system, OmpR family, sensor kinase